MNGDYDAIVVGAGPCAVAALSALPRGQRLAAISGAEPAIRADREIHPKIRAVALEAGEPAGLADPLDAAGSGGGPLYAAAIRGGLANYWGQQFVRYEPGDPYASGVFHDYGQYLSDCEAIESLFSLSGGAETPGPPRAAKGYILREPRLLSGTADEPGAGLRAMRRAANGAADVWVDKRAIRLSRRDALSWEVLLSDGSVLTGRKVWLAAGVLGDARILLASMAGLRGVRFADHSPYMAYATGLRRLLRERKSRHFNAFSIERIDDGRCVLFGSVYDMSAAELNLILASTVGKVFPVFKGLTGTPMASIAQPVQIWTDRSFAQIEVDSADGRFRGVLEEAADDPALKDAVAAVQGLGGRIWRVSRTAPGLGFHHHDLKLLWPDRADQPVAAALKDWSQGSVVCVDGSILPRIGLRPHTLSAMATARRVVLNEMAG